MNAKIAAKTDSPTDAVMQTTIQAMLQGDRRALARLITAVENNAAEKSQILSAIYPKIGQAYIIGITGAPGAGKSSMTDCLIRYLRAQGLTVGVVAVDPNSPFTGGAILGDRIRMQSCALDDGVFIRSMSTRGSLGGMAHATVEVVKLLDAFGKDIIIIETVGVGQSEYDIMNTADTTLVVLTPGGGDGIQSIKAGIMEIADIFVVNKADLAGVDRVVGETEAMLQMRPPSAWRPPVLPVIALKDTGFAELWQAICNHRSYKEQSGQLAAFRAGRRREELRAVLMEKVGGYVRQMLSSPRGAELSAQVSARTLDPYTAADQLLAEQQMLEINQQ